MASGTITKTKGVNELPTLSSSDDLNNLVNINDTGFYYITSKPTNSPVSWCILQNFALGGANIVSQTIYSETAIYIRRRSGTTPTWSNWHIINGTVLS